MRRMTVVLLALGACGGPSPESVVWICLDTVRADAFTSPSLADDRLSSWAARALRFERGETPAPWTVPAIASAFTGLYPYRHGAGSFTTSPADLGREVPSAMAAGVSTLAERLAAEGVGSAAFIAHPWFTASYGLDRGFGTLELAGSAAEVLARGAAWLSSREPGARSFLYLHLMEAHDRHRADLETVRLAAEAATAAGHLCPAAVTGDQSPDQGSIDCLRYRAYLGAIAELRAGVAGLLDELERQGRLEHTLVVLFSDHGESFGAHRELEARRAVDPRGFYGVGHGQSLATELLRVPLLLWGAGREGEVDRAPASLVDLAPTTLRWLEVGDGTDRSRVDGLDLLGGPLPSRVLLSSSIAYGPERIAALDWPLRMVLHSHDGTLEQFDLEADPLEQHPALGGEAAPRLRAAVEAYRRLSPAAAAPPTVSDETLEALQSLGYLAGPSGKEAGVDSGE